MHQLSPFCSICRRRPVAEVRRDKIVTRRYNARGTLTDAVMRMRLARRSPHPVSLFRRQIAVVFYHRRNGDTGEYILRLLTFTLSRTFIFFSRIKKFYEPL